ncbi:MAG: phosphonopyruvate decarboxylase [Bulleidia sp.]|nr:phosphonopyruvate decarboxylase [Bulleidia sp.]
MKVEDLVQIIGSDFYTGVPDSQLKPLCNYLMHTYGIDPKHHVIAANEGNCTALAAGYHLAKGKVPVVYMQNSGEGNIINPCASLLNEDVYGIPVLFIVGWRGEPGLHDEPQHVYQGKVTISLLDVMGIESFVITKETTAEEVQSAMDHFKELFALGKDAAFVIRRDALSYDVPVEYRNDNPMKREDIIRHVIAVSGTDPIVSTTGKASRELFEARVSNEEPHSYDFLTVGSMGHCSSIALGVAINKPKSTVWCIDGDGAVLMHMGSMAVIAECHPDNLIHIVINNGAHETVGGMPTALKEVNVAQIAKDCGYAYTVRVNDFDTLDQELKAAKERHALTLIEVMSAIGARNDLGRPTTTAMENKQNFMEELKKRK